MRECCCQVLYSAIFNVILSWHPITIFLFNKYFYLYATGHLALRWKPPSQQCVFTNGLLDRAYFRCPVNLYDAATGICLFNTVLQRCVLYLPIINK